MDDANTEQWKYWGGLICGVITESTRLTQRVYTWKGLPVSCLSRQNQQNQDCLSLDFLTCVCAQSCPALCDPVGCSSPGSCVRGIFQARILELIAISYSRVTFQPGIELMSPASPALAGRFFTHWATWEALLRLYWCFKLCISSCL